MDRQQRLKRLKEKPPIELDYASFIAKFNESLGELRELFGTELSIKDLDRIVTELKAIDSIAPAIERFDKSISKLNIPESIKLEGFEGLQRELKDIKLPEAKLNVKLVNDKQAKDILDNLKKITKAVKANSIKQDPKDYIPYRRVIYMGNRLIFDDNITSSGSSGGGGGIQDNLILNDAVKVDIQDASVEITATGLATEAKQDTANTSLSSIDTDMDTLILEMRVNNGGMAMQVDDTGTTLYQGWAEPGSATSGTLWRIRRVVSSGTPTDTSITFADGNRTFDNIWDNRAGLSYS